MQRFLTFGGALTAVVIAVFFAIRSYVDDTFGRDRAIDRGFGRVTITMRRDDVQRLMRSAGEPREQFHIGQENGFEREYEEAARTNSRYWLRWTNGDHFYCVGFDANDRATYKASGGT